MRFRRIPVRMLVPNVITLLAICAGLTAIRLAIEGKLELAIGAIVFAAALDGIDGRVARLIKGQSKFGAELDSLADFVNFGVAPALILYFWDLHTLHNAGWIAAIIFAISGGLRLARFNAAIDDPDRPPWAGNFFTGVPAPAGAITVLLPAYLHFLGFWKAPSPVIAAYMLVIAYLMVSRLPVFSGKKLGQRVSSEVVLPFIIVAVLFIALLIAYPWQVLTFSTIAYLASLPFGWRAWQGHERAAAAAKAASPADTAPQAVATPAGVHGAEGGAGAGSGDDRPSRLN